jgi:kumamolisin
MDAKEMKPLPGSLKQPRKGARIVGDIDPEHPKNVTVVLRPKEKIDLAALRAAGAPHLTYADMAAKHGADPADVENLEAYAAENQLTVSEVHLSERTVVLRGRTADVLKAFKVDLKLYADRSGDVFTGREGYIYVPAELSDAIEAVMGIDDRSAARAHFRRMSDVVPEEYHEPRIKLLKREAESAAAARALQATEVGRLYNFPAHLDGKGQCIAMIELGGNFSMQDMRTYFSSLNLPTPSIVSINVLGGGDHDPSADEEVALDIQVAGAIAPHSKIAVYFAPNTDAGFVTAVRRAAHDSLRKPSVISISWGGPESSWTDQAKTQFDAALQEAAALGVTVLVAAGDDGSADESAQQWDGLPHADFPSTSPHALSCGGTKLTGSGGSIGSEVVWNEGVRAGAGGGGVSEFFAKPAYQNGVTIPAALNGFVGRGVPDLAGNADPVSGYIVFVHGQQAVIGGTSAVAPLYAGLIALINQARKSAGGQSVGFIQDVIYPSPKDAGFRDITQGDNDIFGNLNGLYTANVGWDACTGLGSADGSKLLALFSAARAHVAPPPPQATTAQPRMS